MHGTKGEKQSSIIHSYNNEQPWQARHAAHCAMVAQTACELPTTF